MLCSRNSSGTGVAILLDAVAAIRGAMLLVTMIQTVAKATKGVTCTRLLGTTVTIWGALLQVTLCYRY